MDRTFRDDFDDHGTAIIDTAPAVYTNAIRLADEVAQLEQGANGLFVMALRMVIHVAVGRAATRFTCKRVQTDGVDAEMKPAEAADRSRKPRPVRAISAWGSYNLTSIAVGSVAPAGLWKPSGGR